MTPQPGTAGTDDDPLDAIETTELVVNGQTIDALVGLAFDSANQTDGVLRFDGSGSTNGITDGSAKVLVNGTVHDVAGGEWVDFSGTSHSLDSWEKVVNSQFDVTITSTNGPVAPGNTLDVTADATNNGTDSDTQTVTLDINNGVGQVDSTSVTLAGGGSATKTLSWSVPSSQTKQGYQATVSSNDDTASQTVTVAGVVDNFEDNGISEYGGDTGKFQTQTGTVFSGAYALRGDADSGTGPGFAGIASTSGLDNYPAQGDVFECRFRMEGDAYDNLIHFGSQTAAFVPDGYEARMDFNDYDLQLAKRDSGFTVLTTDTSPTFNTGEWYRLEVTWETDGSITAIVEEDDGTQIASVSTTDTTYSSGGVGFFLSDNQNGATGYWDDYQITGSP